MARTMARRERWRGASDGAARMMARRERKSCRAAGARIVLGSNPACAPARSRGAHMRYMLLLYVEDRPRPGTPEAGDYFRSVMDFHRECQERGVLVSSDPLL